MKMQEDWLLKLIEMVRTRPGAYLGGRKDVDALAQFIAAFSFGRESVRPGSSDDGSRILSDFARWLAKSEGEAKLKGWVQLVWERGEGSKRDDTVALFFELFAEFSKAHPEKLRGG
jgi:hypothetical protein